MKKLSLAEVKRRIRNHEALPDDVVKWYPKLMSRYTIRKAKRNPSGFAGKESRPRLKRHRKGEYRRSARSKELYPRAFVKNPYYLLPPGDYTYTVSDKGVEFTDGLAIWEFPSQKELFDFLKRNALHGYEYDKRDPFLVRVLASNPSRVSRIKSHVKAHLDKDQRDFQKEIDEDDELKRWLDRNPKFSAAQRRKYAASGVALPDGSFPIRNRKDLMDALHDLGRTKHYAAAKRHIIKRARALGLTADLNPEWVRRKGKKRNPSGFIRSRHGYEYRILNESEYPTRSSGKLALEDLHTGKYYIAVETEGRDSDFYYEGRRYDILTEIPSTRVRRNPKKRKRNSHRYRELKNGDLELC